MWTSRLKQSHVVVALRVLIPLMTFNAFSVFSAGSFAADESLPLLTKNYSEQVVRIPVSSQSSMTLEATIFKPPGNGPFPVLIFNHGKDTNPNAHQQLRSRPWPEVREFVMRGYVVVAPNRQGFAGSDGVYAVRDCNVTADGLHQAEDVRATVTYLLKQTYVDSKRIVISGASQGGLVTMAYGALGPDSGVRGLINFNGGSRQVGCPNWDLNIVEAYADYGHTTHLPSLWIYGRNDRFWSPEMIQQMVRAYRQAGGEMEFADMGVFKSDSHNIPGDPDGTSLWWPSVEAFLNRIGMPTQVLYRSPEEILPASHFALIEQADKVPYLDDRGRDGYRDFLKHGNPRIFTLSAEGKWSFAISGDDPLGRAMADCQRQGGNACKPYAIDNDVVWVDQDSALHEHAATVSSSPMIGPSSTQHSSGYAAINDVMAVPYINDHGREIYRQFLAHSWPRAIVVTKTGSFTISYGGSNPLDSAMRSCQSHSQVACEPYAINDTVVWVRP